MSWPPGQQNLDTADINLYRVATVASTHDNQMSSQIIFNLIFILQFWEKVSAWYNYEKRYNMMPELGMF